MHLPSKELIVDTLACNSDNDLRKISNCFYFSSLPAPQPHHPTYQSPGPTCPPSAVKRLPVCLPRFLLASTHLCQTLPPGQDYPPVCLMLQQVPRPTPVLSSQVWTHLTWLLCQLGILDWGEEWWDWELPCQLFHTLLVTRIPTHLYPWKTSTVLW